MKTTVKLLSLIMLPAALMLACATTVFAAEQVSMTSAERAIKFYINKDATDIHIDWEDGTKSSTNDGNDAGRGRLEFYHRYASEKSHTIVIAATNFKLLDCSENQLTSLDVSKNTALTELHCGSNQLTSLDVSKCSKLKTLDVRNCKLLSRLYCNYDKVKVDAEGCDALSQPNH
jgi:hypothetical protein